MYLKNCFMHFTRLKHAHETVITHRKSFIIHKIFESLFYYWKKLLYSSWFAYRSIVFSELFVRELIRGTLTPDCSFREAHTIVGINERLSSEFRVLSSDVVEKILLRFWITVVHVANRSKRNAKLIAKTLFI